MESFARPTYELTHSLTNSLHGAKSFLFLRRMMFQHVCAICLWRIFRNYLVNDSFRGEKYTSHETYIFIFFNISPPPPPIREQFREISYTYVSLRHHVHCLKISSDFNRTATCSTYFYTKSLITNFMKFRSVVAELFDGGWTDGKLRR